MEIKYLHFDVLDSTNKWVKTHVHELPTDVLTCITAKEQTAGSGRFKRAWISPPGNLYASLFFTLPPHAPYLPNLGQILSLSCATFLQEEGFAVQIKWPNDLLMHNKKIAGILAETVSLPSCLGIVLGIGLNLKLREEDLSLIPQPAASLNDFSIKEYNIQNILNSLIPLFLNNLSLLQQQGFAPFQPSFESFLAYRGTQMTLKVGSHPVTGECMGIAEDGRLKLLLPNQEVCYFWNSVE